MGLFVTNPQNVLQPGVFPVEVAPPTIIDGVSNGRVGLVFQGEWGPVNSAVAPTSGGTMLKQFFPPGSSHSSTGYYAVMRRKKIPWTLVRILGGAAGLQPCVAPVITQQGAAGASTVKYVVVGKNATGACVGSAKGITTTSNAALGGGNGNIATWAAIAGATSYDVYRTDGGPSQGKIGNTATLTFTDSNIAGDATSPPTTNTSGWAFGVVSLLDSTGVQVALLTVLYAGTLGNSITVSIAAAADGVANHFDMTVALTNTVTGTTQETYRGLQTQATSILPVLTQSNLLLSFTLANTPTTRPANGTYTTTNGSNGAAATATDYNTGLTQLALQDDVRTVAIDDCGDSIRAATNANVQTHVDAKTDRMAILHGNQGNTWAQVKTDVASYRDDRVIYCGQWVKVLDDVGNEQVSPFATVIASALANNQPQESHGWWADQVTDLYQNVVNSIPTPSDFTTSDSGVRDDATQLGICVPIRLPSGRYAALHDRTSSLTNGKQFAVTRRIKDYLGLSIRGGSISFVNGPNIQAQQNKLKHAVDTFLGGELTKGRLSAFSTDIKTPNSSTSVANGQFFITINGTSPSVMEDIFINMNVGPGVLVVTVN